MLIVVFLILAALLRAIVAPLSSSRRSCCRSGRRSASARFFFEQVFGFAGRGPLLPLFVFVFLVALGVDYNIFLMTRVHEEATGTARGAAHSRARRDRRRHHVRGLVLAGTFARARLAAARVFDRVGFAVAFGVLLDTFVVRSVLVTALNLDIGPACGGRPSSPPRERRRISRFPRREEPQPESAGTPP